MKISLGVQKGSREELKANLFYSSSIHANYMSISLQDENEKSEEAKKIKETIAILEFFFHRNSLIQKDKREGNGNIPQEKINP